VGGLLIYQSRHIGVVKGSYVIGQRSWAGAVSSQWHC